MPCRTNLWKEKKKEEEEEKKKKNRDYQSYATNAL